MAIVQSSGKGVSLANDGDAIGTKVIYGSRQCRKTFGTAVGVRWYIEMVYV